MGIEDTLVRIEDKLDRIEDKLDGLLESKATPANNIAGLSETGYLRIKQIIPDLIPISRSAFWLWVKNGKFPKPIKLSDRTTVWRVEDVRDFLNRTAQ